MRGDEADAPVLAEASRALHSDPHDFAGLYIRHRTAFTLLARRYLRDCTGDLNNSLQLEVELKGLGSAGQKTERVLRRAILGYDRDDLYLVPPQTVSPPVNNGTSTTSDPTP